jgi:hypothetical protein
MKLKEQGSWIGLPKWPRKVVTLGMGPINLPGYRSEKNTESELGEEQRQHESRR